MFVHIENVSRQDQSYVFLPAETGGWGTEREGGGEKGSRKVAFFLFYSEMAHSSLPTQRVGEHNIRDKPYK
jgi:hypothetical protein